MNESTVLTVDTIECENGHWRCYHGEKTNETAMTFVSIQGTKMPTCTSLDKAESNSFTKRLGLTCLGLLIGLIVGNCIPLVDIDKQEDISRIAKSCGQVMNSILLRFDCSSRYAKYIATALRRVISFSILLVVSILIAGPNSDFDTNTYIGIGIIPGVCIIYVDRLCITSKLKSSSQIVEWACENRAETQIREQFENNLLASNEDDSGQ